MAGSFIWFSPDRLMGISLHIKALLGDIPGISEYVYIITRICVNYVKDR